MSPRSIRRAAERKAEKLARKTAQATEPTKPALPQSQPPIQPPAQSLVQAAPTLTGRTVLLPADEAARYEQHIRSYFEEYRPVGLLETALVQSIADTAWRLRRTSELEMGIYALGHAEQLAAHAKISEDQPDTRLFELQTFLKYEKQLRSLQLQESRLRRNREKDLAELKTLQADRVTQSEKESAEEAATTESKSDVRSTPKANGGFVLSTHPAAAPIASETPLALYNSVTCCRS